MNSKSCRYFIREGQVAEELRKNVSSSHYIPKELGVKDVRNGYVLVSRRWNEDFLLEGGVVDSEMHYLEETGYADGGGCSYEFDVSNIEVGGKCVYLGLSHPVYGHAITDALKRLWYLSTEEGRSLVEDRNVDIIYLTGGNVEMPKWHCEILKLAGVDFSRIKHVTTTTKYSDIIIPDNSLFWDNGLLCYCEEFLNVIDSIKENVHNSSVYKSTLPLDLYFTRTALSYASDREVGEKEIESYFKSKGFSIVSPESLSIEEQISLLMKAKRFAATEGSCSHSSIFCDSSSEVIILRKANYINQYSTMIADLVKCKTVYIDVHHSINVNARFPMCGPFYLCKTKELSQYFNENIAPPYFLRFSWLAYRFSLKQKLYEIRRFFGVRTRIMKIVNILKHRSGGATKW